MSEPSEDRWAHWPAVTAADLALLYLDDADQQVARSPVEPLRLAQAAKSIHHSLQAALTAALAGGMGIGAYTEKVERQWLAFLQEGAAQPQSDRVMTLGALLEKATTRKFEWTQQPLALYPHERAMLEKLDKVRDRLEHPRPGSWVIEPAYLLQLFPPAAEVIVRCMETVQHQIEEEELSRFRDLAASINRRCGSH